MIKGKYADVVMSYVNGLVDGSIIAGEDRILGAKRFLAMLEDERYDVRTHDADFVIGIIEKCFRHRQGEKLDGTPIRNTPFLLEPWQKYIIYAILIFWYKGTQERVVKEAFIFIPRKNGKTILVSALSWALSILQRRSGSGVFARDADALLDMIEPRIPDAALDEVKAEYGDTVTAWRLETTLREFARTDPDDLFFSYPLHELDTTGDPG